MGTVLYNKYRSKNFSEVIGQDYITASLDNALKNNKVAHAYLFTGPRGVGKTSVARILAHLVNNLDYGESSSSLDIIEIDAASNRRIDEIRDLRDKVNIAPSNSRFKVYIIDEVHMLTREAFNALLKTLEEPPEHVIFILATTESSKLPDTIISRTQRYNFRPIPEPVIEKHLKTIAKKEKIKITDEAIKAIAKHGDGSFRDSISILDQIKNQDSEVTLETVNQNLGLTPEDEIRILFKLIEDGQSTKIINNLNKLYASGYTADTIAKQLSEYIRSYIILEDNSTDVDIIGLLKELIEIPSSQEPNTLLEITLYKYVKQDKSHSNKVIASSVEHAIKPKKTPDSISEKAERPKKNSKKNVIKKISTTNKSSSSFEFNKLVWQDLLNLIKKNNNTIYGILKTSSPKYENGILKLIFGYTFHQKRINDAKIKEIIVDKFYELTGQKIVIEAILDKTLSIKNTESKKSEPDISAISNIFDGAKVIKSE